MGNLKSLVSIMFGTSFLVVSSFAQVNLDLDSIFLSIESSGDYIVQKSSWLKLKSTIDFEMKTPPKESVEFWESVRKHPKAQMEKHDIVLRNILSMAYNVNAEYRKAAYLHIENIPIYQSSKYTDDTDVVVQLQQTGRNFREIGIIDSALIYLQKASDLAEEKEIKGLYGYHLIYAELYSMLNNSEKSRTSWMNAWKAIEEVPNHSDRGYFLYLACKYFFEFDDPELFSFFLERMSDYQKEKPLTAPKNHYPIYNFVYDDGEDVAIDRLRKSYEYSLEQNNIAGAYNTMILLSQALKKRGRIKEGISGIEGLLSKAHDLDSYLTSGLYYVLQELYNQVGDYANAYDAMTKFTFHRNEFVQDRVRTASAEAEVKYETEKKEKELIKKETELSTANQKLMLFGFGGIGLLGITGLLLRSSSFRKKVNKELKQKNGIISNALKEKDDLLKEIHHRVKNNLQIISSLLSLQSRKSTDEDTKAAIQEGRDRVRSMALIHQNLYVDKDKVSVKVEEYIPKLVDDLSKGLTPNNLDLEIKVNVQPMQMDIDTIVPIGLIINELVTNALKYGFVGREKGSLKVAAVASGLGYGILIEDDGVGYDKDSKAKGSGLGRQLISSFCEKLNAELIIKTDHGKGTRVEVSIPQTLKK